MNVRIEEGWRRALADQWDAPYFAELTANVRRAYSEGAVFPPPSQIFAAFDATPFDNVKVVIIGQDPYHGPGQANGLCFSVAPGIPMPPSLVNIFKEIVSDMGRSEADIPADGDLGYLARQGVLLLNSTLTVAAHSPASHRSLGWETLTDAAIKALSAGREGIVYILWGSHAIRKAALIDGTRNLILTAPHPSPLSAYRGFFGCRHFSRANRYLAEHGKKPVEWL